MIGWADLLFCVEGSPQQSPDWKVIFIVMVYWIMYSQHSVEHITLLNFSSISRFLTASYLFAVKPQSINQLTVLICPSLHLPGKPQCQRWKRTKCEKVTNDKHVYLPISLPGQDGGTTSLQCCASCLATIQPTSPLQHRPSCPSGVSEWVRFNVPPDT